MGFSFFGIGQGGPNTSQYMGRDNLNDYGNAPGMSSLSSMLANMPQFQSIKAPTSNYQQDAYKAKDMSSASLPQYDAMRTRLNSQYSQTQDQSQQALDRQFAAMGGGPGNGAQAKQTENLATGIAQQKGNDLENVNAQEANARTQLQREQDQMAFQSGESQKGYAFQAGQADIGRQFSADEFNQQMQQGQNQFNFGSQLGLQNFNLTYQKDQADARNAEFNKALADYQAQHSGGVLGGGGFLGTGLSF